MWVWHSDLYTCHPDFGVLVHHGLEEWLCQAITLLVKCARNGLGELTATDTTFLQKIKIFTHNTLCKLVAVPLDFESMIEHVTSMQLLLQRIA